MPTADFFGYKPSEEPIGKRTKLKMPDKVQGSLLFVTYTIIQGIIGSEMLVGTGPLNGKCKKEK